MLTKNILYIHGAFIGCKYSIFRNKLTDNGGLFVREQDLNNKFQNINFKIHHYIWAQDYRKFNFIGTLNIFNHVQTYLIEKEYVEKTNSKVQLHKELQEINPILIIAHSLGGKFIIETLDKFGANSNLKKIITLNTVIDKKYKLSNKNLIQKLRNKDITWVNYYCPWDYMMLANIFVDKHIPSGLFGINYNLVKNKFLFALPNPLIHDYALKNKNLFIKELKEIV